MKIHNDKKFRIPQNSLQRFYRIGMNSLNIFYKHFLNHVRKRFRTAFNADIGEALFMGLEIVRNKKAPTRGPILKMKQGTLSYK